MDGSPRKDAADISVALMTAICGVERETNQGEGRLVEMNVLSVQSKLTEGKLRGLRRGHGRRPSERQAGPSERQAGAPVAPRAVADRSREKRLGGYAQDNAVYNCGCGMVFEAAVSTAVSCPNCGSHQAW